MVNAARRAARLSITDLTINTMSLHTMKVAHVAKMKKLAVVSDSRVTPIDHIVLHKKTPTHGRGCNALLLSRIKAPAQGGEAGDSL